MNMADKLQLEFFEDVRCCCVCDGNPCNRCISEGNDVISCCHLFFKDGSVYVCPRYTV